MIAGTIAVVLALAQDQTPQKAAKLRPGELIRLVEQTMSRRGTFENVMVITSTKAFSKTNDARNWTMLTAAQQAQLKTILSKEPTGLRNQKRPNPMWPSAYDASDMFMAYRVGRITKYWGNNEYEYPTSDCPLTKFLEEIKHQLSPPASE